LLVAEDGVYETLRSERPQVAFETETQLLQRAIEAVFQGGEAVGHERNLEFTIDLHEFDDLLQETFKEGVKFE